MKNVPEMMRFDERVLEYLIRKGDLDKRDYEKFLKALPDETENVDYIDIQEEAEVVVEDSGLTFVSAIMKD